MDAEEGSPQGRVYGVFQRQEVALGLSLKPDNSR
jgi:hypothetical protein